MKKQPPITHSQRFSNLTKVAQRMRELVARDDVILVKRPRFWQRSYRSQEKAQPHTLESLLETLIAFPTVDGNDDGMHAAMNFIARYLGERGMHVRRHEYDGYEALAATTRPTKTPRIMLAAHLDVVPGGEELFTLRKADGKYYGRGVFDMKFAIACYLKLVDELQSRLHEYDFGIMITTDEELGGSNGSNGTQKLVDEGYVPKLAAVLPDGGDNWNIEEFAKGIWTFDITAKGHTAHASRPWEGDSATTKLLQVLQEISALFEDQGPKTSTFNVGIIQGGEARNQIPALASASLDVRYMSGEARTSLAASVAAICKKYHVQIEPVGGMPPLAHKLGDPYLQSFMQSIQTVTGVRPEPSMSFGGTDGKSFDEKGKPCVIVRPHGGGAHSNKEWLDVADFTAYKEVIQDFLDKHARPAAKGQAELADNTAG